MDTATLQYHTVKLFDVLFDSIPPAAARAAVRRHWEICLLGSDDDELFFIRGLMARTSDDVRKNVSVDSQEGTLKVASEPPSQAVAIANDVVTELSASVRQSGCDGMVVPAERPKTNEPSDSGEKLEEELQVGAPEVLEVEGGAGKDSQAQKEFPTGFTRPGLKNHIMNNVKKGHSTPTAGPKPPIALPPEQHREMTVRLENEERRHQADLAKVPPDLSVSDRDAETRRLKACSASRKFKIRSDYGVKLRGPNVATANAVRTASGGAGIAILDTPPSTNGFAAITRIDSLGAEPSKPDSKRRRMGDLEVGGRNPCRVPQREQYSIIPRSTPLLHDERPPHSTPKYNPHQRSHYQQQQPLLTGSTSVNIEQSGSTPRYRHDSPLAKLKNPIYVDPKRHFKRHAHRPNNNDTSDTYGVLKSDKVRVHDAQIQSGNLYAVGGHYGAPIDLTGTLSDPSSDSPTPPSVKLHAQALQNATPMLSSATSSIPPEAHQSAEIGGRSTLLTHGLPRVGENPGGACGQEDDEESDSDDGSDTSIPARRKPVKNDANRHRATLCWP